MKIAGRIIQNKNISINTESEFSAQYKKHYINVKKVYKPENKGNPEWDIDVRHFDGGFAANTYVQRCNIHDAILYALEGSLL